MPTHISPRRPNGCGPYSPFAPSLGRLRQDRLNRGRPPHPLWCGQQLDSGGAVQIGIAFHKSLWCAADSEIATVWRNAHPCSSPSLLLHACVGDGCRKRLSKNEKD